MSGTFFCLSDRLNVLSLQLAGFFSVITALCFPLLTLLFGRVFNEFIDYAVAEKFRLKNLTLDDYFCEMVNNTMAQNDVLGYLHNHTLLQFKVATLTFLTLGISLAFFVVAALSRSFSAVAAAQTGRRLRYNCFSTLVTRHVGWFEVNSFSEFTTLLLEGMQIVEVGLTQSIVVLQQSVSIIFCLVIAFVINWKLALATSILLPFLVLLIFIIGKTISLVADKEQDALLIAASVAEESLASIETVKMFEGQEKELHRYLYHIGRANRQSRKILMLTALMVGLLYLIILTIFTTGSWFGLQLMTQCQCDAGSVFLVTAEIVICAFSISELLPAVGEVVTAIQSATLIKGIIGQRSKIDPVSVHGMTLPDFEGGIEFSNVVFSYPSSYPGDDPILNGINFRAKPGQIVALIGPSGCGKSTILNLIPRLYNIQEGMIRFDNVDGKYLSIKWLRSQIGLVSHEPALFNVSIAENIGYGKEGVTMEEIIFASKMANAHGFITDLPYGYTSVVGGKGGVHLSRGQRQLVALARALVRDPKILLLDATTSDPDKETEEEVVLKGIDKAREGRTTIIVAHRLSTVQKADVIIGIDRGRVVEMGSHSELMEEDSIYKSMLVNEVYKDEFSTILEEGVCSGDIDSNRLTDELDRASSSRHHGTQEDTSEKSPLLLKSAATTTSEKTKRTTLSLYREVLSIVLSRAHWFLLIAALVFFVLAGAIFSSFFILYDKLVEYLDSTSSKQLLIAAELYTPFFSLLGLLVLVLNFIGVSF